MIPIFMLLIGYAIAQTQTTCSTPSSATCDRNILNCCEANFRASLGFNSSTCSGVHLYDDINCYRGQVFNIYFGQGGGGVLEVCDAYNSFLSCLDKSIRSCTTYGWYMEQGIKDDLISNIFYQDLLFQCGPGLEYFLNNEQCMLNAYNTNINQINQCLNNFVNGINSNPPPGNDQKCAISDTFVNCYAFQFQGCGDGGQWWGCEIARKSTNVLYPVCDTSCRAQLKPVS